MTSIKATAHRAGAIYFLFTIVAIVGEFLSPTYFGEVPVVFWLLIKGAKVPQ